MKREGFKRRFLPRKPHTKQIVSAESLSRRRHGGEADEDELLCVIYGAAGLRFIYLYCIYTAARRPESNLDWSQRARAASSCLVSLLSGTITCRSPNGWT